MDRMDRNQSGHKNAPLPDTVAIILRTHNEAEYLGKVLEIIGQQTQPVSELIIVDSESQDATVKIAEGEGGRVIMIPKESFSYGRSLNIGFSESTCNILVSLSAHAIPQSVHWLERLMRHFADPNIAAVSSKILPYPDNSLKAILRHARFLLVKNCSKNRVWLLWNTSTAYRKSVWDLLPFSESVRVAEDREWAVRSRSMGYDVIYEPSSSVLHCHFESNLEFAFRVLNNLIAFSHIFFLHKIRKWIRRNSDDRVE